MRESWRCLRRPALTVGLVLVALVYLLPLVLSAAGLTGHRRLDPFRRVLGHREAGVQAGAFFKDLPRPDKTFVMAQGHRYHASHLAFYLPGRPQIYRWERYGQIVSQYELWPNAIDDGLKGWDALIFLPDRERNIPSRFRGSFQSFERLGEIVVTVSPHYEKYYQVFLGRSLIEWPPPLLREPEASSD